MQGSSEKKRPQPRVGRTPDAELVALLRDRDPAAWEELRGFLRRLAASKAWGSVDESHGAEDYVQLACLRLWKVLGRPGREVGGVSLKAYLAVTMQNLVREVHRRRAGVTHVGRGAAGDPEGATADRPRHRVDLDEAERVFDDRGVPDDPDGPGAAAEYESRAADAFAVLDRLASADSTSSKHVRAIAARILERTGERDAAGLLTTLDRNLFQLLHGDTTRWSERKRTKHRVRLNRFREAFIRALVEHRRGKSR